MSSKQPTVLLNRETGIGFAGLRSTTLGGGLGLGVVVLLFVDLQSGGEALQGYGGFLITVMVFVMTAVGLLATLGPARRGACQSLSTYPAIWLRVLSVRNPTDIIGHNTA